MYYLEMFTDVYEKLCQRGIRLMDGSSGNKPMVSIAMLAYNHEKYIGQALDSILMQKTTFSYEIVVGEDCSLDNTRKILLKYKEKYPDKIRLILHEKNIGMHKNVNALLRQCNGKYCANCEGDDYWTDPYKLQKQIDFLEKHPEYIGTAHKIEVVDINGKPKKGFNMNMYCQDTIYTIRHAERGILPGQYSSCVYRNILIEDPFAMNLVANCKANGDAKMSLYLALNGDIYCFDEVMSHYRWVTTEGDSWSARTKNRNLNLYSFVSYTELAKLANKLKNIDMNYNSLYLHFGYVAFVVWLKRPNNENRKILMNIYTLYTNKAEMILYIIKKVILYPAIKIKNYKARLEKLGF